MNDKFQNSEPDLSRPEAAQNVKLEFERADWTSFRTVEGLQQKAGVPQTRLRRLVLKELTDNALDTGTPARVGEIADAEHPGYFIEDQGPGLDPGGVARLFSIRRPLMSTKLLRLPTRGALGNGLRVAVGAVLASDGFLTVITCGRRIRLKPQRDGATAVIESSASEHTVGTRVEIGFGPDLPADGNALNWANLAIHLARGGSAYAGQSSPWWYDVPQFHELLSASGAAPVRAVIASLDGCAGGRAGDIVAMAGLSRMAAHDIDTPGAARLLVAARAAAKPVNPKRLGAIGPDAFPDSAYAFAHGSAAFGSRLRADIPAVVEVWAWESEKTGVSASVNRTPIAADLAMYRDKSDVDVFGCGLSHTVAKAPKGLEFAAVLTGGSTGGVIGGVVGSHD